MDTRQWGIVKWYEDEKGYGRIMLEGRDGDHVFVHFSDIQPNPVRFPTGYRFLNEGQKVTFDLLEIPTASDSQRRTAKNVHILD